MVLELRVGGSGATVFFDNLLVTDPSGVVLSEDFNTVTGPTAGLMEGMDAFAVKVSIAGRCAYLGQQ